MAHGIPQKIEVILKRLDLTQTELAGKLGVSFPTLNSWKLGKSSPRLRVLTAIEHLYLEVTGQRVVPKSELDVKKRTLRERAAHRSIISEILNNPDIRDEFALKLTYHSNKIEGSTLSEPDTAAILFDNVALSDKSLTEQLDAKNHQSALYRVFEHVRNEKKIGEQFLLNLHAVLMGGIRHDAGLYRRHAVRITGIPLPTANYIRVPELTRTVVRNASKKPKDPIAHAARIHASFEQVHPFSDGNGRIGRLLMHAMLLSENLPPAIIRQESKQLYYTFLYKAQTGGDHSQLEDFLCEAVQGGFDVLERRGT